VIDDLLAGGSALAERGACRLSVGQTEAVMQRKIAAARPPILRIRVIRNSLPNLKCATACLRETTEGDADEAARVQDDRS
jgi:hypothetical protein